MDGESFGELLRVHRVTASLTQEALADRAGVSVHGISMLERGARRAPRPGTVRRLAAALGLDARQTEALEGAARGHGLEPRDPRAGLPPKPTPYFVGRERELAALQRQLREEGRVTVHGMGGVGKTQVAARYVHRRRTAYADGVFWLRADQESSLLGDLANLAGHLALPESKQQPQEPQVAAVVRWLREHRRWLLVLDNLEPAAQAAVDRWLHVDLPGHLLITSRTPLGAARLELDPMPLETATRFLLRCTGQDDATAASDVAEALGGLPLALAQAAAYMDVSGRDLAGYARMLQTRLVELMSEARPEGYPETVATTWHLSLERLEIDCPEAVALLRLCAFLAPDDIPVSVLQASASVMPQELRVTLADDLKLDRAIAALRRYSLAQREGDRLRVHRLVQAVVRETTCVADRAAWLSAAVRLLEAVIPEAPDQHPDRWPLCARLVPHALFVENLAGDGPVEPGPRSAVLTRVGSYLFGRGEYRSARTLLQLALSIREQTFGPEHPDTAQSLDDVAMVLYMLHVPAAARALVERAVAVRERVLGRDHPLTADCLGHLALLHREQGELAASRALYERALAINERALGSDHKDTVRSLFNLGTQLEDEGEHAAAAALLEQAREACERTLGPDDLLMACVLDGLAMVRLGLGDGATARSLAERALAIRERVLGPDHRHTAVSLDHLALAVMRQGEVGAARVLLERAVETRERVLGPDHPHTADSIDNLGILLQRQGDSAGARGLVERALRIRERTLGPDHLSTADSIDNLAILLQQQGESTAAADLVGRALAIRERALGRDHPDTVRSRRLASLPPDRLGAEALRAGGTAR